MRRRRTFVTNRSIPCSFTPSVRSNQICFALKQNRVELRKKNFLIGITRHRFLKVYLSPRSRTFVSHRFVPCLFLFSPFRSNQTCYVPKQSRVEIRKKQRHRFPKVYLIRRPAVIAAGSTNVSRRENSPFWLDLLELI